MMRVLLALALMVSCWWLNPTLPAAAQGLPSSQFLAAVPTSPPAPTRVPRADVAQFAQAYQAIQEIRATAEADMVQAVEAVGLTVDRFNAIADSQTSDSAQAPKSSARPDDPRFSAALDRILALRQQAEMAMASAIEETGLSVDRFNQILDQANEDSDLYQRIGEQLKQP
ncbi:MAG TPA: DUF4168 domain-containing protein [Leptolyngbyaceae cyanobacterium M65_K2018_010]|nr:DUF4168 domain-containing protein [Leptolyngbyaceae cyanobacterium M65_K2018_010]